MSAPAKLIAAGLFAAALLIVGLGALTWAQQASNAPQVMEFQHSGVFPGAPSAAPAMSLKDVPPHAAELSGRVPKLTHVGLNGNVVHIHPTVQGAVVRRAAGAASTPPRLYHAGGAVMNPWIAVYLIFWVPPTLQNGGGTGLTANYVTPTILVGAWLENHGLLNIATQYYQTINGVTTYVPNNGGLVGLYVDTAPYPAAGCTDPATSPGNCITDAQIQAEITRVMGINGWTGGMNKVFVLLTSSGEGSCIDGTNTACAYAHNTGYCAYHSFFSLAGQNVMYANIPFGNPNGCQAPGQTTPNDPNGDLAANVMSHEIVEVATDPLGDAWFDSSGNEIGDLCNFNFGSNTWGSGAGAGNQMWNGVIFELQQQYDNHAAACAQVGPQ